MGLGQAVPSLCWRHMAQWCKQCKVLCSDPRLPNLRSIMCLIWRVGCHCLFRNLLPFCQRDLHVQCDAGCKDVWQKTRGRKQCYPQPFVDGQCSPETAWGLSTGIATTQAAAPFSKALLRSGVLTVEAFGLWIVRYWGYWKQRMLLLILTVLKSLWSPIDGKSPGRTVA